jgi:putative membrane-bound dehydrogenase-like protein
MSKPHAFALFWIALLGTSLASGAEEENAGPSAAPLAPSVAPHKMALPDGFKVSLFAAEPDVHQPIAFTIDPRGRLWVVECYSYPIWLNGPTGGDRIIILEDTDGDGTHDKRTVFWDKGTSLTGIALGFGGVWVCATPDLLFIPDADGDDTPDGPPVVKLDGWDVKAQHNMFNALNWAPDGWLWGCNGIMSNSRVGAPGTPDEKRTAINTGVWRYHPVKGTFEVVANGTTNPWGLDFNSYGEAFITNCVIPHLFTVVPGARFIRMYGQDFNPHSYGLMGTTADHIHWAGGHWTDSRSGAKHGEAGGGHAHVGAMVYLGDNWPDSYRDTLFTCNIHGHRVNNDTLELKGSGYVARHRKDFLLANDDWFRGLELKYGPDGGVYLTDWSDTGECHENDADNAHRENGRIYKITYGDVKPVHVDLSKATDAELVSYQRHKNDWYARTARHLIQERAVAGKDMTAIQRELAEIFHDDTTTPIKLRAMWAYRATGGLNGAIAAKFLSVPDEFVRVWAVRFLAEDREFDPDTLKTLATMAKDDPSPRVRLALASALQSMDLADRWPIAAALLSHGEDESDASLPLMDWYGFEPLAGADPSRAIALVPEIKIPVVRRYTARRAVLADEGAKTAGLEALAGELAKNHESVIRQDILDGILDALEGRKDVKGPASWSEVAAKLNESGDPAVKLRADLVSLRFGMPGAADGLKAIAEDRSTPIEIRRVALQALVEARVPNLSALLRGRLDDPTLRADAIRSLAAVVDPETPKAILKHYASLSPVERDDAINTLASRPEYASVLLDAIAAKQVSPRDVSTTVARQIQALGRPEISAKLESVWGTLRPTSTEKVALMARYKELAAGGSPNAERGRDVFEKTCLQCHKLYDQGGDVGPELTGSDRGNLDYILENVLDPSATVGRDYRLTIVGTTDGRVISGLLREQNDQTLTLQTVNERIVLPREDVEEFKESPSSMMPEGLLEKLSDDEVRDLMAYLASKAQIPPASPRK